MSDERNDLGLTAADTVDSAADVYFEFRGVCKAFDEREVLTDVSFQVKRGQTCVIMGRSGVGKSVTLKLILGFLKPDSGRIWIAGQDVTDFTEREFAELRGKVTMVFQSGALFDSLTVAENIAFPMEDQAGLTDQDIDEYVMKLAKTLEVEEVLDKLPSELSTGMKRAVAIARALAQNPEAILYDEPTTMVDPIMAGHMGDLIARLKETFRKTSIVVTHDTHLAKRLAPTITVNALGSTSTATVSATINGTAGLTKSGAGTLTLSGASTYSGATTAAISFLCSAP